MLVKETNVTLATIFEFIELEKNYSFTQKL